MSKVKCGAEICNIEDVKNLIIGIIFRQKKNYAKEDVIGMVTHYLQDSLLVTNENTVNDLVESSLDLLQRNGDVICENGIYRTIGITENRKNF